MNTIEREAWEREEWSGPGDEADQGRELGSALDVALEELAERDREAVMLRFLGQQSFLQIGRGLGLSEDAARQRVDRALKRLRERLERRGITSSAAVLAAELTGRSSRVAPAGLAGNVAKAAFEVGTRSMPGWFAGLKTSLSWKLTAGLGAAALGFLSVTDVVTWSARTDTRPVPFGADTGEAEHRPTTEAGSRRAGRDVSGGPTRKGTEIASAGTAMPAGAVGSEGLRPGAVAAEVVMARHPEVRRTIVDWQVAKVHFQFGPLFRALALDARQIETFAALVRGDHFFGEWGAGGEFLEFRTPREVPVGEVRARLAELLGEQGLRAFDEFKHVVSAREITAQVAARLSLQGVAPTREQADVLASLFEIEPWRKRNGGTWAEVAAGWSAVVERARLVLTEGQLAVLQEIGQAEQEAGVLAERQRSMAEALPLSRNEAAGDGKPADRYAAIAAFQARIEAIVRHDPRLQNAENELHRAQLEWQYAGAIRSLDLTPDLGRQLLNALHRRSLEHADMLVAARSLGISDYDPALERWNAESDGRYRAELRDLLGEAGAREMKRFEDTTYPRHIAHGFAGIAAMAGLAVTDAQVERLIGIMVEATRDPPAGVFPARVDIDWATVDRRAEGVLSAAQASLFRTAEAPGVGRGGARFVVQLNHALMRASRREAVGRAAAVRPP